MSDRILFEPGASVPLFVVLEDDDGVPIPDPAAATVRLSVLTTPVTDIPGVFDPDRQGFSFDLDLLGPVMTTKKTVKAVFYADWGDGWDRMNEEPLLLKPLEGAHWQVST